jgi:hypothetical protein
MANGSGDLARWPGRVQGRGADERKEEMAGPLYLGLSRRWPAQEGTIDQHCNAITRS